MKNGTKLALVDRLHDGGVCEHMETIIGLIEEHAEEWLVDPRACPSCGLFPGVVLHRARRVWLCLVCIAHGDMEEGA